MYVYIYIYIYEVSLPFLNIYIYTYMLPFLHIYIYMCVYMYGPSSSIGIATDYGLDGPGSNPGGDEIFHPSRSALGPTQPPVKWAPKLSRGKSAAGACC